MLLFVTSPIKLYAVVVNVPSLVIVVPVIEPLLTTTPLFVKFVAVIAASFVNVLAALTETAFWLIVFSFVTVTPLKFKVPPLPVTDPFVKLLPE